VGPLVALAVQPSGRHPPGLAKDVEGAAVQDLGADGAVEALDQRILRPFAGLDMRRRIPCWRSESA
jgi:hypothetical protein